MVKYFACVSHLKSSWDQVCIAFWERYPNPYRAVAFVERWVTMLRGRPLLMCAEGPWFAPVSGRGDDVKLYCYTYSNHVLTEDIIFREVTPGNRLVSRRLLTKTNRAPRWMEKYLPVTMARHAYIIEDSIVDPQNRTMTTLTWNISHARMMSVEERCEYRINPDNSSWTEINREAWISSNLYGLSRPIQEFGLARFKTSVTKTMKGFEDVLAKMQGEAPSRTLAEHATERARETALAAKEKAKDLASQAHKKQQYV